jgi:hypothetical protein
VKKILNTRTRCLPVAVLVVIVTAGSLPTQAEPLAAQWKVYQIRFNYYPFHTFYSCDALESKLERLLILLGARDDARVEVNCHGNDDLRRRRAQRSYNLLLAFAMPVPADKTEITKETFPAEWQDIRVVGSLSRYLDGGDCELVDQFQRYVLPYLQVKKENNSLHCVPMRRPSNKLRVHMTSLRAVERTELEEKVIQDSEDSSKSDL